MSKYPLIEPETITKFLELVEAGSTRQAAATAVGRNLHAIRLWIKRNDREMPPHISDITARVLSHADDYRTGLLTQSEIAEAVGCSKPYVSRCLHQHTSEHIHTRRMSAFHRIIDHIKEHGGYPKPVAKTLGISIDPASFYRYLRDEGIDLSVYRQPTTERTEVKATD